MLMQKNISFILINTYNNYQDIKKVMLLHNIFNKDINAYNKQRVKQNLQLNILTLP
jgi:hypothetical protein